MQAPSPHTLEVPGIGPCLFPREFAVFTGTINALKVHDAREPPRELYAQLAGDIGMVLTGPYVYVEAVFRYCQRQSQILVSGAGRWPSSAARVQAQRQKLHRLLVLVRGERLVQVEDAPDVGGLQEWMEEPPGDVPFLIPIRRLQRLLTDMRRAREGLYFECLGGAITILPHVYVPADQSVPGMFVQYQHLWAGKRVLDMGTGTGILALLAARLGATRVVATDSNPRAVANARLNVERFSLQASIEVRDAGNLFEPVRGEIFDTILFNAPWFEGEPRTLYDAAHYDPDRAILSGFLKAAPSHLAPEGAILLQYSDVSDKDRPQKLDDLLADNGLRTCSRKSIHRLSRVLGARERVDLLEIRRA